MTVWYAGAYAPAYQMLISIFDMFWAALCPSPEELYQCDTWFMSLCVEDRLVCRSICSCIPDGDINQVYEKNCVSSLLFTRIIPVCTDNKT